MAADDIAPTFHPACPVLHFQMKMMPMPSSIGYHNSDKISEAGSGLVDEMAYMND